MLTLSCLISQAGQATVMFAGELDAASAGQAYGYVRDAIDAFGGSVLLDVASLSFCDACGPGAFARMSRHAAQAGSSVHLVAPPPLLRKIIRITGLAGSAAGASRRPGRARASSVRPPLPLVT
jgi:anti-sigma B factor antagonist